METLRAELTPLPERIKALPVHRGYPVPWFVGVVDGIPEFRVADGQKFALAVRNRLCWVCGERLGSKLSFVLGPMCGVTRSTAEPPCHKECAVWSAMNCPFLARPHMTRRDNDLPEGAVDAPGISIRRNPGCALIWTTQTYRVFPTGDGRGLLLEVGDPISIEAYAEGKETTMDVVMRSIDSGMHLLREQCDLERTPYLQKKAHVELDKNLAVLTKLLEANLLMEGTEA